MIKSILFLYISSFLITAESHEKELKLQKNVTTADYYLRQISSHGLNKTRTKTFQLDIYWPKTLWNIQLLPNSYFLSLEYKQNASIYTNKPGSECEFTGSVNGIKDSWVALTLCGGIRGLIHLDGSVYEILSSKKYNSTSGTVDLKNFYEGRIKMKCGVDENSNNNSGREMETEEGHRHKRSTGEDRISMTVLAPNVTTTSWHRYIEVFVVVDHSLYVELGSSLSKVHQKCKEIMNIVYVIFRPLEISVVMTNIEVWQNGDKIRVMSNHVKTLTQFKSVRWRLLQGRRHHDYTLLLTNVDFLGNTVGYAYINGMCHFQRSAAVVQYGSDETAASIAGTVAHELGHGLGANHDKNYCQTEYNGGFGIMIGESMQRLHWSNCSKMYFAKYIDTYRCLRNVPETESTISFCGNGIIDDGEQCDCGTSGACVQCCNLNNCTLRANASCGSGLCCNYETCNPQPPGTMCRQAGNACDLPEYCSGKSPFCPKDVYKVDGYTCDNAQGHCYHGLCGSKNLLCQEVINPAAKDPDSTLMDKYRHPKQSPCGEFYCQPHLNIKEHSESRAIINDHGYRWYNNSSPLVKYYANESYYDRPRMNGVPCGDGKMCVKKLCASISQSYVVHCKSNCSNHGICNSKGNCHCEDQYAPPDCASYGYGGSVDSGHARRPPDGNWHKILLMVAFFGLIPATIILCFSWAKLRKLWRSDWHKNVKAVSPPIAKAVNNFCCPCMNFVTNWTNYIKPNFSNSNTSKETRRYSKTRRATICEVDVNVNPPETEIKSWGVASSMLAIDMIQVTPQNSPDTRRKICLPPDSPTMRPRGDSNSGKSLSVTRSKQNDAKCRDEQSRPDSFSPSMGSLISIFNKFGSQKSKSDEHNVSHIGGSRPQDLRRFAVDPMSRRAVQDSPYPHKPIIPFHRSVSENPQSKNNSPLNPSLLLSKEDYRRTHENVSQAKMPSDEHLNNLKPLEKRAKPPRPPLSYSVSHTDDHQNKCPPLRPPRPVLHHSDQNVNKK